MLPRAGVACFPPPSRPTPWRRPRLEMEDDSLFIFFLLSFLLLFFFILLFPVSLSLYIFFQIIGLSSFCIIREFRELQQGRTVFGATSEQRGFAMRRTLDATRSVRSSSFRAREGRRRACLIGLPRAGCCFWSAGQAGRDRSEGALVREPLSRSWFVGWGQLVRSRWFPGVWDVEASAGFRVAVPPPAPAYPAPEEFNVPPSSSDTFHRRVVTASEGFRK